VSEAELLARGGRVKLERVGLEVARQRGPLRLQVAYREPELDRVAARGLGDVADPQADVIDLSKPNHPRVPAPMIDRQ